MKEMSVCSKKGTFQSSYAERVVGIVDVDAIERWTVVDGGRFNGKTRGLWFVLLGMCSNNGGSPSFLLLSLALLTRFHDDKWKLPTSGVSSAKEFHLGESRTTRLLACSPLVFVLEARLD